MLNGEAKLNNVMIVVSPLYGYSAKDGGWARFKIGNRKLIRMEENLESAAHRWI
jgi:hypothetical protein